MAASQEKLPTVMLMRAVPQAWPGEMNVPGARHGGGPQRYTFAAENERMDPISAVELVACSMITGTCGDPTRTALGVGARPAGRAPPGRVLRTTVARPRPPRSMPPAAPGGRAPTPRRSARSASPPTDRPSCPAARTTLAGRCYASGLGVLDLVIVRGGPLAWMRDHPGTHHVQVDARDAACHVFVGVDGGGDR